MVEIEPREDSPGSLEIRAANATSGAVCQQGAAHVAFGQM